MQTTIRFFVSCFLCLALLFVSGCGGGDSKQTMIDAIDQLGAAVEKMQEADYSPESLQIFKKEVGGISVSGCPKEFRDAFVEARQAMIENAELAVEIHTLRKAGNLEGIVAKLSEAEKKTARMQEASNRLKEVA